MKTFERTNYEQTNKGYSTGYSSLYTRTVPYNPKTISQIKRDNEYMRQNNRKYIETMYRTGGFFTYDLKSPHTGTHRSHLYNLERRARDMVPEVDFEKNRLNIFHTQCINMRTDQKNEYNSLRRDMLDEVDNLQMKLTQNLNKQKIANIKNKKDIKELKNEFLDSKNKLTELKMRVNSLKLRIDGTEMYNSDGIPVLNTKLD